VSIPVHPLDIARMEGGAECGERPDFEIPSQGGEPAAPIAPPPAKARPPVEKYTGPRLLLGKYRKKRAKGQEGGRPVGVLMPCGWCGFPMRASTVMRHFMECKKRPVKA